MHTVGNISSAGSFDKYTMKALQLNDANFVTFRKLSLVLHVKVYILGFIFKNHKSIWEWEFIRRFSLLLVNFWILSRIHACLFTPTKDFLSFTFLWRRINITLAPPAFWQSLPSLVCSPNPHYSECDRRPAAAAASPGRVIEMQNYWIRNWILTRSLGDSYAH
jgi:hypothetical protein